MATGLGAFTGGVKSGYKFVSDQRRDKLINKAIAYDIGEMGEKKKARDAGYKFFDEDYSTDLEFLPETWGSKLLNWGKGKLGFEQKAISPVAGMSMQQLNTQYSDSAFEAEQYNQPPVAMAKHGGAIDRYADGGSVRHMVKGYAHGGKLRKEEEITEERKARYALMIEEGRNKPTYTGSGPGLDVDDISEGWGNVMDNVLPNTQREMDDWRPRGIAADRKVLDAKGAANTGSAIRSNIAEGARGIGHFSRGLFEDSGAGSLARGVGGFFGFGTDDAETAAVRAIDPDKGPDIDVAAQPDQPDQPDQQEPPAPTAGAGAGAGQTTPGAANPAVGADQTGVEDDPLIDFSTVRDVSPAEMPSKGKLEWEKERNFYAAQAIANGRDPLEALKAVDAKQMRGFTQYGQMAVQMLQNGDCTGAANALYAAYQYFPNGVDAKFGIHRGKDDSCVLIGMGTDEETGEPIKEGKPTVITVDSLAAQIENMTNPGALRAWTKDWQNAEAKAREYNEVTRPAAESEAIYKDRMGKAAMDTAASSWQRAVNAGSAGGMKQADIDRAITAFESDREMQQIAGGMQAQEARKLTEIMARMYIWSTVIMGHTGNRSSIIAMVMDSYESAGGGAAGIAQAEQDLEELGAS